MDAANTRRPTHTVYISSVTVTVIPYKLFRVRRRTNIFLQHVFHHSKTYHVDNLYHRYTEIWIFRTKDMLYAVVAKMIHHFSVQKSNRIVPAI